MARRGDSEDSPDRDEDSVVIPFPKDTPQERGRKYERERAKEDGLRLHPASGAAGIKHDASDDNTLVEYKTADKQFVLNGRYALDFHNIALRQDKEAILECNFQKYDLTVTMTFRRT